MTQTVEGEDHDQEVTYGVLISKMFRGFHPKIAEIAEKEGLYARIRTPKQSGLCGAYLTNNTEYLLSGGSGKRGLSLSSCDLYQRWNRLSEDEIASLNAGYDCGCRVTRCKLGGECSDEGDKYEGDNYCKMYGDPVWDVKTRSCMCSRNGVGACSWDRTGC